MALLILAVTSTPSYAKGKYDWFSTNQDSWNKNGIICYQPGDDIEPGQKFTFTAKLGQSKKFISLGSGVSVSGGTLVNAYGEIVNESSQSEDTQAEENQDEQLTPACGNPNSTAYIAPKTLNSGGAWTVKLTVYKTNKSVLWYDTFLVLRELRGINSGSSFFTNPPNIYFNDYTYANISPSFGVKSYTDSGKPRNACLLVYDVTLKGAYGSESIYVQDLTKSFQGGFGGANIRAILGNGAIPTALKCASWIANYLW